MKQVYCEVYSPKELQALDGCKIVQVYGIGADEDEGLCLDCQDKAGNLVSFLITEDGSWHPHEGKEIQDHGDGTLTKEKILKLKPSRELDLHVAIDVAGMNIDEVDESKVPNYSTDDKTALQLLKDLFYQEGYEVEIHGHPGYGWYVNIKEDGAKEMASVCYPTLSESISKATLLDSNGF